MNLRFTPITSVNNPKSVHGIYPYRGKISGVEAQQFISQLPQNITLLDPFCGSGTIVYEAAKHGLKSFGVDMNPLAVTLAQGKLNIPQSKDEALSEGFENINLAKSLTAFSNLNLAASKHFHEDTAIEIARMATLYENLSPYLKACFLGAICLTARGCNHYKWTSSTVGKDINPKNYINFYEKFSDKISKHYYPVKTSNNKVFHADARNLLSVIEPESIDLVYTSPPYFDCLDYTAYYAKIIYEIFEVNREEIRSSLIQNYASYKDSMTSVLAELHKVCKKNAQIVFVVGDKKIHGKVINGADFFNEITPFKVVDVIERGYTNSSSKVFDQINKTERKEQIIIWKK